MSGGPGAVLAHLRTVTRPAHDALEGALGLLDGQLQLAVYTAVLQRFYGFWRGWEPQVTALLPEEALLGRRRLHLLAADLEALGLSPHGIEMLPSSPSPPLADAAEALGSLYVMEGSTLGGRVILRHVERRLGLDPQSAGCAYFAGYGARTGMMWQSFLARLDAQQETDRGRIAQGATATFECLGRWLTPPY